MTGEKCATLVIAACVLCLAASGQPLVSGPVVVFLGPPGSGRTTQAAAAAKYLKVPIISAADMVTENAAELKKARKPGITGIEPETDPLLNRFFEARLRRGDCLNGVILDGYPNTKDHADFAAKLVASGAVSKPIILHLQVPDDVVRKRLAGKDGTLSDSVQQMLKDYHRETTALKIYFPNAEIVDIDGTKKPKAVSKNVQKVLKAKFGKR
jgi:adenylate kinase